MSASGIIDKFELHDAELRHDIAIPGYAGKTTHVLVFIDKKADTYYWVTSTFPSEFEVGKIYDIRAKCDRSRNNRLGFVKIIKHDSSITASEQPEKPDAEDILLGLAHY